MRSGLYSAIVATLVASIFGSSSHLINSPTNAVSLVVLSALTNTGRDDTGGGTEVECTSARSAKGAGQCDAGGTEGAGARSPEAGCGDPLQRYDSGSGSQGAEKAAAHSAPDLTRLRREMPEVEVAESTVRRYVRERRGAMGWLGRETFVPQSYLWGSEAQGPDRYEGWRSSTASRDSLPMSIICRTLTVEESCAPYRCFVPVWPAWVACLVAAQDRMPPVIRSTTRGGAARRSGAGQEGAPHPQFETGRAGRSSDFASSKILYSVAPVGSIIAIIAGVKYGPSVNSFINSRQAQLFGGLDARRKPTRAWSAQP